MSLSGSSGTQLNARLVSSHHVNLQCRGSSSASRPGKLRQFHFSPSRHHGHGAGCSQLYSPGDPGKPCTAAGPSGMERAPAASRRRGARPVCLRRPTSCGRPLNFPFACGALKQHQSRHRLRRHRGIQQPALPTAWSARHSSYPRPFISKFFRMRRAPRSPSRLHIVSVVLWPPQASAAISFACGAIELDDDNKGPRRMHLVARLCFLKISPACGSPKHRSIHPRRATAPCCFLKLSFACGARGSSRSLQYPRHARTPRAAVLGQTMMHFLLACGAHHHHAVSASAPLPLRVGG